MYPAITVLATIVSRTFSGPAVRIRFFTAVTAARNRPLVPVSRP